LIFDFRLAEPRAERSPRTLQLLETPLDKPIRAANRALIEIRKSKIENRHIRCFYPTQEQGSTSFVAPLFIEMSILLPLKPLQGLSKPLWLPAPEYPGLPVNELHIWRASLDSVPDAPGRHSTCPVSRDGTDKLKAALFRKDILERYTNPESGPAHPTIVSGPASGLRIAIAQCDHLALIAVSRDVRRIGIDVERVCQDIPIEEMAGGFLDAHSQWDLRITWSPQEKAWKFFQFWTSNEACEQARPSSRTSHACQVRGFSPEADFIAALAIEGGPEAEVLHWDWNGEGINDHILPC
jgi:hypothetical protein